MVVVRVVDGRVFIESRDPANTVTYERWCEVLGAPGVDRDRRAALIADAINRVQGRSERAS